MLIRLLPTLLLATLAASLPACKGDTDTEPESAAKQLQYSWTWQSSAGGISGGTQTPASTGQQRKIEFDNRGTVRWYTNGQLTRTGTYTVRQGSTIYGSQPTDIIDYGSGTPRQSFSISGRQLTLRDEAYDGFTSKYQR